MTNTVDATFLVIINARVVYGPVSLRKATAYINDRMWALETSDHAFIAKVVGHGY